MKKETTNKSVINSKLGIAQFVIKQAFSAFLNNQNNKSTLEKYQIKLDFEKKILTLEKKINSLNYKLNSLKNKFIFVIIVNLIIILYLLGIFIK